MKAGNIFLSSRKCERGIMKMSSGPIEPTSMFNLMDPRRAGCCVAQGVRSPRSDDQLEN